MSTRTHTSLTYRPALDGLRGIAVVGVLVFHLWPSVARGGWLGVDLFFVLSGYLITTLLVREYIKRGRIDLLGFWLARARRLLPTLVVVLLAVLLAAAFWTLPSRRGSVAADVLAAFFYVANWHFLIGDEAYFNANGTPSPLRHTWSLAIEEQYYIVFPLLLLLLARFLHRRRHLALAFAVLAGVSAAWMASLYTPGIDPTRVYYGTDTRAFELLIGAAAGAWVGPAQWGHARQSRWLLVVERGAWPSLAALVVAMVTLDENSSWLFRGGLVLFCLVSLVPILAAASPHTNSLQRVLSFEWLRRLGLVSYALYLWHWPLHVFLTPERLHLDAPLAGLVQAAGSLVLATATYRFVEAPIRRGGLAALLPKGRRRLAPATAAVALAAVVAGAFALPHVSWGDSTVEAGAGGENLQYAPQPYTPGADQKVILVGNSIPHSLLVNFPQTQFPDLTLTESTSFGCTTFDGQEIVGGEPSTISQDCKTFHGNWYYGLQGTTSMLYFLPQNLLNDYRVDGKHLRFDTPAHDAFIRSSLDDVARRVKETKVAHPYLVTLSCHQMPAFSKDSPTYVINEIPRVKHLDAVSTAWARGHGFKVIDQYGFLCPGDVYHGTINGTNLYADALHFTSDSGPIVWNWLAHRITEPVVP